MLEANIAVPYAFSQLGAFGQAHDYYTKALDTFDAENKALDESIAGIRAGKLIEGLLERNPGEEMGWFWNIRELPQLPHPGHLSSVLAQHEFQEAFKNYRDLQFLAANLNLSLQQKQDLATFNEGRSPLLDGPMIPPDDHDDFVMPANMPEHRPSRPERVQRRELAQAAAKAAVERKLLLLNRIGLRTAEVEKQLPAQLDELAETPPSFMIYSKVEPIAFQQCMIATKTHV